MSEVKGVEDVLRNLDRLIQRTPHAVAQALFEEASIEALESMRRTPVDTGALRGSTHVTQPQVGVIGGDIQVEILVGGPAAPYAIEVHENTEVFHNPGQAKFLESTVMESAPHLANRIAARILKNLGFA